MRIAISDVDSDRFGVAVARADSVSAGDVPACVEFCADRHVDLLVARCSTTDLAAVHALEACGSLLMDCLVHYRRAGLDDLPEGGTIPGVRVRAAVPDDAAAAARMTAEAFAGYRGHYHADPRLDTGAATQAYASWMASVLGSDDPCSHGVVAEAEEGIIGAITFEVRDGTSTGKVAAVHPEHAGRGVYRALMLERLHLSRRFGASTIETSTHVHNVPSQTAWTSLGFRMHASEYTFHRWSDAPGARVDAGQLDG